MTPEKLKRTLHSVGYAAFVKHFDVFAECPPEGPPQQCLDAMIARGQSENIGGAHRRCYSARQIFRANMERDALLLVIESTSAKITDEIRETARDLRKRM